MAESALKEILERSAAYFEGRLWESEVGNRIRARLLRAGITESSLRSFRVGYAPGNTKDVLGHLAEWGYPASELTSAGIVSRSHRDGLHVLFHARIMFPITDCEGRVLGFAALATHLGPSWPLWLTSPDRGPFDGGSAMFGIQQARPAIRRTGKALVLRDCVQVLALHEQGRREAVGVIQSPITRRHAASLASALQGGDLQFARRDGALGVVAAPAAAGIADDDFAARDTPAGFSLIDSTPREERAKAGAAGAQIAVGEPPQPARPFVYLAGLAIGVGMPMGALVLAAPYDHSARGSTPTLNVVVVSVAVGYLLLALLVSRISARVRARSKTRRMREPWARGMDEWQPSGWTYHRLEEILVGAALASAITCIVLLMTIGGFLG